MNKWYKDMDICPECGSVMKFTSNVFVNDGKERIEACCKGCGDEWILSKPEEVERMSELQKYDIYAYSESDAAYAHPIIDDIPETENGTPAEGIEWVKASDAEAALAEKDARIKELEDALRMIKANSYFCNSCSASMYAEEALEARK